VGNKEDGMRGSNPPAVSIKSTHKKVMRKIGNRGCSLLGRNHVIAKGTLH